jgi:hypothetical protein
LNTPDFVLLFIPIESSFGVAVQEDQDLFNFAWDNKIVIVSPSTLLATLRTIASIWKQENQTKNAIEIANQGGALFDKFVGFVKDLEKIGANIRQTQNAYDDAMNKLHTGKGNLVSNTDHKREKSAGITQMVTDISCMFSNPELATSYMENIRAEKPRYVRDQLILLKQTIENTDKQTIDNTLQYCLQMKVYSANDFKSVAAGLLQKRSWEKSTTLASRINPLNGQSPSAVYCQPMQSAIADYELLMQNEN